MGLRNIILACAASAALSAAPDMYAGERFYHRHEQTTDERDIANKCLTLDEDQFTGSYHATKELRVPGIKRGWDILVIQYTEHWRGGPSTLLTGVIGRVPSASPKHQDDAMYEFKIIKPTPKNEKRIEEVLRYHQVPAGKLSILTPVMYHFFFKDYTPQVAVARKSAVHSTVFLEQEKRKK